MRTLIVIVVLMFLMMLLCGCTTKRKRIQMKAPMSVSNVKLELNAWQPGKSAITGQKRGNPDCQYLN